MRSGWCRSGLASGPAICCLCSLGLGGSERLPECKAVLTARRRPRSYPKGAHPLRRRDGEKEPCSYFLAHRTRNNGFMCTIAHILTLTEHGCFTNEHAEMLFRRSRVSDYGYYYYFVYSQCLTSCKGFTRPLFLLSSQHSYVIRRI